MEFERAPSLTENLRQRNRLLERARACVERRPKADGTPCGATVYSASSASVWPTSAFACP